MSTSRLPRGMPPWRFRCLPCSFSPFQTFQLRDPMPCKRHVLINPPAVRVTDVRRSYLLEPQWYDALVPHRRTSYSAVSAPSPRAGRYAFCHASKRPSFLAMHACIPQAAILPRRSRPAGLFLNFHLPFRALRCVFCVVTCMCVIERSKHPAIFTLDVDRNPKWGWALAYCGFRRRIGGGGAQGRAGGGCVSCMHPRC